VLQYSLCGYGLHVLTAVKRRSLHESTNLPTNAGSLVTASRLPVRYQTVRQHRYATYVPDVVQAHAPVALVYSSDTHCNYLEDHGLPDMGSTLKLVLHPLCRL
jgi:hypothetical protein